jgi:hypothetical protein
MQTHLILIPATYIRDQYTNEDGTILMTVWLTDAQAEEVASQIHMALGSKRGVGFHLGTDLGRHGESFP